LQEVKKALVEREKEVEELKSVRDACAYFELSFFRPMTLVF